MEYISLVEWGKASHTLRPLIFQSFLKITTLLAVMEEIEHRMSPHLYMNLYILTTYKNYALIRKTCLNRQLPARFPVTPRFSGFIQ